MFELDYAHYPERRVCEDRTLEQTVVLRSYARRADAFHLLQTEMRRLDTVYNGALLAPHFSERLEVSDEVIQRLIERLYFPYSPYRFDVIGVDLLGAAYERFLGKELTLDERRRVRLEDKPEVRHAGATIAKHYLRLDEHAAVDRVRAAMERRDNADVPRLRAVS